MSNVLLSFRYWKNTTFLFLIQPPSVVFSTYDSVLCSCKCGVCSGSHMLSGIILPRSQMLCDALRKRNEEIKRLKKKERNGKGVKHVAERLEWFLIPGLRVQSNYLV